MNVATLYKLDLTLKQTQDDITTLVNSRFDEDLIASRDDIRDICQSSICDVKLSKLMFVK
jgi:hypothetical protein